jgi:putative heme iron utilization protein
MACVLVAPTMATDPLTPAVSERICKHMNEDHAEAVLAYARHYGGVTGASSARMVAIEPDSMRLEVDGTPLAVPFDHSLSDSEDAHRTLVAMLRALPRN